MLKINSQDTTVRKDYDLDFSGDAGDVEISTIEYAGLVLVETIKYQMVHGL